ncbi:MAG TPA: HD domain-containing protein [Candidatus Cloacimonadota bacterium]|nr:HD domain-containing protein [Candidatus Cloacimonadota bacterium]
MDRIEIKELAQFTGKEISSYYLAAEKDLREGKGGKYLRLRLQDKSGSCNANVWNNAQKEAEQFEEGDVVKVNATVTNYKGQIQLSVNKIRMADQSEYNLEDFLAKSQQDPNALAEEFFRYVESVKEVHLKQLLKSIFEDKEFFSKFAYAPAAKSWHHNYIHGLLEHTVSVARLCEYCAGHYNVNYDLLITGALLHDVGKVYEYQQSPAIEFTDLGRLVGHLTIGDQMVCAKAAQINNFPSELLMLVRHMILAHHGEYEKASVRLPQTIESLILHLADNLDAQATGVQQLVEISPSDAQWSEFDKLNNRYYYIYHD